MDTPQYCDNNNACVGLKKECWRGERYDTAQQHVSFPAVLYFSHNFNEFFLCAKAEQHLLLPVYTFYTDSQRE